jgi:hypothetical protein
MHTIGVLLLAAATAGDGFGYSQPNVGGKKLFRSHAVVYGPPPPGGPMAPGAANCPPGGNQNGRRFPNTRSQLYFLDPAGMKIGWQVGTTPADKTYLPAQLTVPARYNFRQGYIYRLKLTDIPGRPGVQLYPTIEVAPSVPATDAYLTHNPIPLQFTPEDFDQVVDGGNFVTKVIYLPDPKYQELAIAGVETLVSTRLEPGVDPILEADKRGTILLIVRLGAIDLEIPTTGASSVPTHSGPPPVATPLPPGSLPPGVVAPGMPAAENVPVDNAPVTPVPPPPGPQPPAEGAPPVTPPSPAPAPAPDANAPPAGTPATPEANPAPKEASATPPTSDANVVPASASTETDEASKPSGAAAADPAPAAPPVEAPKP